MATLSPPLPTLTILTTQELHTAEEKMVKAIKQREEEIDRDKTKTVPDLEAKIERLAILRAKCAWGVDLTK